MVVLLVVYVAGWERDSGVTLAFLAIATTLIGLPAGWELTRRRNGR